MREAGVSLHSPSGGESNAKGPRTLGEPSRDIHLSDVGARLPPDASHAWTSQALRTLRGVSILFVVGMHATMPYLAFTKLSTAAFTEAPYSWLAFPIVDSQRWFGFDLFAAWLDVYLMSLMFFLSGLFVRSGLVGKGARAFLTNRLMRLGAPFVLALVLVMPIALYPVYLTRTPDATLSGYIQSYSSLPFFPNGPMWFLWILLSFSLLVAALHGLAPRLGDRLGQLSSGAARAPGRYFVGLASAATLAYVPLASMFSPWDWIELGPFSFQLCRPMLYLVYFMAGYGVGTHGLGDGLLSGRGKLAASWLPWAVAALASLLIWMGLTGLTMSYGASAPRMLQVLAETSYAWAGASSVFFVLAACLRLREVRSHFIDRLSHNAFGLYLLHYAPLVWLQYAMIDAPLPAVMKSLIVFLGTLLLAYLGAIAFSGALQGSRGLEWIGSAVARSRSSQGFWRRAS